MKKGKKKRINFSDLFEYAEKKFDVDWNRANDMFFNNSLDYKSYNEFFGGTTEFYEKDLKNPSKFEDLSESDKGYFIINQYMKDNKVLNYL